MSKFNLDWPCLTLYGEKNEHKLLFLRSVFVRVMFEHWNSVCLMNKLNLHKHKWALFINHWFMIYGLFFATPTRLADLCLFFLSFLLLSRRYIAMVEMCQIVADKNRLVTLLLLLAENVMNIILVHFQDRYKCISVLYISLKFLWSYRVMICFAAHTSAVLVKLWKQLRMIERWTLVRISICFARS